MTRNIYHGAGGTVYAGAAAVEIYRLIVLKNGIKLEALGIKARRGQTCRSIARKMYGIRGNAQKQIDQIDKILNEKRET